MKGEKEMDNDNYVRPPYSDILSTELDAYMDWIKVCLEEDCLPEVRLDLEAQLYAAKTVRANIKRVYEV